MSVRNFFLWLFTPIQKLLQKFSRPEPEMSREQVDFLLKLIQKGDILLSYEGGRLTSWFIRGDFDHLVVVNDQKLVVEAVAPKVRKCDLEEWLFKKKGVAIVRYSGKKTVRTCASAYCNKYLGWPYDYLFTYTNKKAYCSEIGFLSYREFDKEFMNHLKRREVLPQDFYDAATKRISKLIVLAEVRN